MKNIKFYTVAFLSVAVIAAGTAVSTSVSADTVTPLVKEQQNYKDTLSIPILYGWKIVSISSSGDGYGAWRLGPSGRGPGQITLSDSNSSSIGYSATISGSIKTPTDEIGSSVGVSINVSKSHSVSYTVNLTSNKMIQVEYRPHYKIEKVTQREYLISPTTLATSNTAVAYVNVFENWQYSYYTIN